MNEAAKLAASLRQIVVLFWILGILATIGGAFIIVAALGTENGPAAILSGISVLLGTWVSLGWAGLMARGLAVLLERGAGSSL